MLSASFYDRRWKHDFKWSAIQSSTSWHIQFIVRNDRTYLHEHQFHTRRGKRGRQDYRLARFTLFFGNSRGTASTARLVSAAASGSPRCFNSVKVSFLIVHPARLSVIDGRGKCIYISPRDLNNPFTLRIADEPGVNTMRTGRK